MGHAPVMCTKIIWDFAMYWGSVALVFIRGKLLDQAFTDQVRPILQSFAYLNIGMQAFFRRWADACDDIEAQQQSGVSMMPEGLLDIMMADQRRDLFGYLMSEGR